MECYTVEEPDIYDLTMRVCLFRNRGRLTHEAVKFFHDRDIEVDTVPVNTAEDLELIREFDLDTITTDAPDVVTPLLREQGLRPLPVPEKTLAWRLQRRSCARAGRRTGLTRRTPRHPAGKRRV